MDVTPCNAVLVLHIYNAITGISRLQEEVNTVHISRLETLKLFGTQNMYKYAIHSQLPMTSSVLHAMYSK